MLYAGSIAENIALGVSMSLDQAREFDRNKLPCTMTEIEAAAKMANAHEFIMSALKTNKLSFVYVIKFFFFCS